MKTRDNVAAERHCLTSFLLVVRLGLILNEEHTIGIMEITDLKLDFDAIEPAYLQLANQLAQEIEKGKYQPGSALPSILTLSRKLAVSKSTVYRAYAHLSSKGLVYWVKFEGFFVKATNRRLL